MAVQKSYYCLLGVLLLAGCAHHRAVTESSDEPTPNPTPAELNEGKVVLTARGPFSPELATLIAKLNPSTSSSLTGIVFSRQGAIAYSVNDPTNHYNEIHLITSDGVQSTLTTGHSDQEPAFGANNFIFFTRSDNFQIQHQNICRVDTVSKRVVEVTSGQNDQMPVVSPDGNTVVFERGGTPKGSRLMKMNSDGSHLIDITPEGLVIGASPTWSQSGRLILLPIVQLGGRSRMFALSAVDYRTLDQLTPNDDFYDPASGSFGDYALEYRPASAKLGPAAVILQRIGKPSVTFLAADQNRLVQPRSISFLSEGAYVANLYGNVIARLALPNLIDCPIAISPRGLLAFAKKESTGSSIYLVNSKDKPSKETVGHFDRDPNFTSAPMIVFARAEKFNGPHQLCVMPLQGHSVKVLTSGFDDRSPSSSSRSRELLFTRSTKRSDGTWSSPRLFKADATCSHCADITPLGLSDVSAPCWAANGYEFLFSAKDGPHRHIYSMDSYQHAKAVKLTPNSLSEDDQPSSLDTDGSFVYTSKPLNGGPSRIVIHRPQQPDVSIAAPTAGVSLTSPTVAP